MDKAEARAHRQGTAGPAAQGRRLEPAVAGRLEAVGRQAAGQGRPERRLRDRAGAIRLRQAGVAASEEPIRRGVAWLKANQRASGRWFTRSLNSDGRHYISNAGTAYAILALKACGE